MIEKIGQESSLVAIAHNDDVLSNLIGVKTAAIIEQIDPGYVYSIVHGIEGDTFNHNNDHWAWDTELLAARPDGIKTYQTWIGKPNCLQHINVNPKTDHYGSVLDSYPIHATKHIDMVLKTSRDKKTPSGLSIAEGIESGQINKVSMGCLVKWSTCTYCGSVFKTVNDYCEHVRDRKGSILPVNEGLNHLSSAITKMANGEPGVKVGEDCHESTGSEMSWVFNPAFPSCTSYGVLNPKPVDQFKALGSALRWSMNAYHKRAGRIIQKACSKGYLDPEEEEAIALLVRALRLEDY